MEDQGNAVQTKQGRLRAVLLDLAENHLAPDAATPSERELMAKYSVSRSTVREVVGQLVSEGRLYRVHGKGTFVARPRVESQLHMASFTDDMRRRGLDPASLVKSAVERQPDLATQAALGLEPHETVWRIARLRLASGIPMAYEVGYYPTGLFPGLLRSDMSSSLYQLFTVEYGVVVDSADQVMWAEAIDRPTAGLLQVPAGAPVLVFRRTSSAAAVKVEYVTSWYRADRYQLHMSLNRRTMP